MRQGESTVQYTRQTYAPFTPPDATRLNCSVASRRRRCELGIACIIVMFLTFINRPNLLLSMQATNVDATTNFSVSLERSDLMSLHSPSMLKYK